MRRAAFLLDIAPLLIGILLALALLAGCRGGSVADAYGNFEATEVTVSAEAQGRLVRFDVVEGVRVAEGAVVGVVDTTRLAFERRALLAQRQSLLAQRQATLAQGPEIAAQAGALRAQLETAEVELERTRRLHADRAATDRELNEREGAVAALREQVAQALARARAVHDQAASVGAQAGQVEARVGEVEVRLRDALVVNPLAGTVLTLLAERGESVQPGTPLYTIASLDTLTLRAYATGAQLPQLRLGQDVEVLVDAEGGGLRTMPGRVTWISDAAQFTPTPIQTRDERSELVYAFDVRVANPDGTLKVGMPGEVRFP